MMTASKFATRQSRASRGSRRCLGPRSLSRVGAVVLLAVLGSLVLAGPANAHTDLVSSNPAGGDTLGAPPVTVRLEFSQTLTKDFASLTMAVGTREPAPVGPKVSGGVMTAAVPISLRMTNDRQPQRWRVAYRVVSEDGHPITGAITFTVTPSDKLRPSPSASPSQAVPPENGGTAVADPSQDQDDVPTGPSPSESGSTAWVPAAAVGLIAIVASGAVVLRVARGRQEDPRT